jgi:type II secretory pathway pseudopilin PulG
MQRASRRTGAVLLEVLVALVILATVGGAAVTLASESARAIVRAREAEAEMRRANAFLESVALWPREDLDRRLGSRRQGQWRLRIDRPAPTLFIVALTDSVERRELLRTALFRALPDASESSIAIR